MSPLRRTNSLSIARSPSSRLRSRISTCDSVGLDQMAGSESFDSRPASSLSTLGRSKILQKVADLVAYRSIGKFEFVQHEDSEFRSARLAPHASPHSGGDNAQADYPTQVGEQIAVHGVEGQVAAIPEPGSQRGERVTRHTRHKPPVGVDDGRDAGVGITQQPAAIFDRTHARHVERLPRRAGVAVPAVVRDVDQHPGALLYEQPYLIAENLFVTDEDTKAVAIGGEDHAPPSMGHVAGRLGQVFGKGKKSLIRYVLSPRDQVNLVVTAGNCAIQAHEK